jgi:hypothetical protein
MLDRSRLSAVPGMRPDQVDEAMIGAITAYVALAGSEGAADLERIAERDPGIRVRSAAKSAIEQLR